MILKGRIYKAVSKFYYVSCNGKTYECMAKGKFKNIGTTPFVGDIVDIQIDELDNTKGNIIKVYERKNQIVRPSVSNIDKLLIVVATKDPMPNLILLDKQLINCQINNIEPIICITKIDIDKENTENIEKTYKDIGYKVYTICNNNKYGVDKLIKEIKGSFCVLSGASGVGKSSLVNNILGKDVMESGDISQKIKRGKQTTRHIEIFNFDGIMIADTPGFSAFDEINIEKGSVMEYFPEINKYVGKCQYRDCMHIKEKDCAVKEAVRNGKISQERYNRYIEIYNSCNKKAY